MLLLMLMRMMLMMMMMTTLGNLTLAKVQEARPACVLALSECTPMRLQFDLVVLVNRMIIMVIMMNILMARMVKTVEAAMEG